MIVYCPQCPGCPYCNDWHTDTLLALLQVYADHPTPALTASAQQSYTAMLPETTYEILLYSNVATDLQFHFEFIDSHMCCVANNYNETRAYRQYYQKLLPDLSFHFFSKFQHLVKLILFDFYVW